MQISQWQGGDMLQDIFLDIVAYSPPCGSCWSAETSSNATVQQQSSAAELSLASPLLSSLRSAPCVATSRGKHWTAQQWWVTWPPRRHAQRYTTLHSPSCLTPAFIRETEGSSVSSVRVSVDKLVATESLWHNQFAIGVIEGLPAWFEKTASVKRRFKWNIMSVKLL
jgi:hypothetical protein